MTVNYTTLLGLAQPVTGTEANAWGDVVNQEITALVEEAIAGGETINVTAGNVTLSTTVGVANQARNAVLLVVGTPGIPANIIAPTQSKVYIVKNSADAAVVLKGAATTGVTIPVGVEALCFFNGSDFEIVGVNGPASSTDNAIARFDSTTGKVIQNSGVTIDDSNNISGVAQLNATTVAATTVNATTADINGGTIDATTVGATTPATGSFTTLNTSGQVVFNDAGANVDFRVEGDTDANLLFVDASTDRVGIGTSSPQATLHVNAGGGGTVIFSRTGFANRGQISAGGTNFGIGSEGDLSFGAGTSFAERLRITSAGNVGIGTSSPAVNLDLTVSGPGGMVINQRTDSGGFSGLLYFKNNVNAYAIRNNDGVLALSHGATVGSTGGTDGLVLNSSGNVGIGTSTPNAPLNVIRDNVGLPVLIGGSRSGAVGLKCFNSDTAQSSIVALGEEGGTSNTPVLLQKFGSTHATRANELSFNNGTNGPLTLATNNTERMRIDSAGNVGIANGNLKFTTNGTGIDFSASAGSGATSSLLDDYEEGDWTVQLQDTVGNNAVMVAAFTTASYVKIGRQVTVTGACFTSSISGLSGDIRISGLPFAIGNNNKFRGAGATSAEQQLNITSGQKLSLFFTGNLTTMTIYISDSVSGGSAVETSEWSSDGFTQFTATYFT